MITRRRRRYRIQQKNTKMPGQKRVTKGQYRGRPAPVSSISGASFTGRQQRLVEKPTCSGSRGVFGSSQPPVSLRLHLSALQPVPHLCGSCPRKRMKRCDSRSRNVQSPRRDSSGAVYSWHGSKMELGGGIRPWGAYFILHHGQSCEIPACMLRSWLWPAWCDNKSRFKGKVFLFAYFILTYELRKKGLKCSITTKTLYPTSFLFPEVRVLTAVIKCVSCCLPQSYNPRRK